MTSQHLGNHFEVSFVGNEIRPETVRISELTDILKSLETLVESQVRRKLPNLGKDQLVMGLASIRGQSIDLDFHSPLPDATLSAFEDIGRAIEKRDFTNLPSVSYKAFNTVVSFTQRKRCSASLYHVNGTRTLITTIRPDMVIKRPPPLTAETTVYAKVVRVGGKEPKVEIETLNGETLFCEAPYEVTTKLGGKLYQIVGLIGIAEWDNDLNSIEEFSIKEVTDYERVPLTQGMNELAKAVGPYYAGIDDVDGYVSRVRGSG